MNKKYANRLNRKFSVSAVLLVLIAALAVNLSAAQTANPGTTAARAGRTTLFEPAAVTGRGIDAIDDGGFENGTPNGSWAETSTNFGTPLCSHFCGGVGPRTGDWFAWFGGVSVTEIGSVTQSITINDVGTGTATLEFYLALGTLDVDGPDTLTVTLGGDTLLTVLESDETYKGNYTLVSIDVTGYADGTARDLVFTGVQTGPLTNFFVDDVALVIDAELEETPTPTEETPEETPTPTETAVAGVELIVNGGFEDDLTAWTVKKGAGDKVKCNKETKVIANSGDCAFKFKGGAGENTKLGSVCKLKPEQD